MEYTVIDVREIDEYASGHVEGSINIPLSQFSNSPDRLAQIPKDADIIVYCRGGLRAEQAKSILNDLGYNNVTNGINSEEVKKNLKL